MLRPIDPKTGITKKYVDYSIPEKLSAIVQLEDSIRDRATRRLPQDQNALRLTKSLSIGTEKEGALDPLVQELVDKLPPEREVKPDPKK